MNDLVLNAVPFTAFVRSRLQALGVALSQAVDAFAEARMRAAVPARLLQAQPKLTGGDPGQRRGAMMIRR